MPEHESYAEVSAILGQDKSISPQKVKIISKAFSNFCKDYISHKIKLSLSDFFSSNIVTNKHTCERLTEVWEEFKEKNEVSQKDTNLLKLTSFAAGVLKEDKHPKRDGITQVLEDTFKPAEDNKSVEASITDHRAAEAAACYDTSSASAHQDTKKTDVIHENDITRDTPEKGADHSRPEPTSFLRNPEAPGIHHTQKAAVIQDALEAAAIGDNPKAAAPDDSVKPAAPDDSVNPAALDDSVNPDAPDDSVKAANTHDALEAAATHGTSEAPAENELAKAEELPPIPGIQQTLPEHQHDAASLDEGQDGAPRRPRRIPEQTLFCSFSQSESHLAARDATDISMKTPRGYVVYSRNQETVPPSHTHGDYYVEVLSKSHSNLG